LRGVNIMCVYCNLGDFAFKHNPPWNPPSYPLTPPMYPTPWHPNIPTPVVPMPSTPWPLEQLKEFEDLLKRVKDMEDKLGCPCEPNKADYIGLLKQRIEFLESKINTNS
jgi:hypothetical protein